MTSVCCLRGGSASLQEGGDKGLAGFEGKPEQKVPRGTPRRGWEDNIKNYFKKQDGRA